MKKIVSSAIIAVLVLTFVISSIATTGYIQKELLYDNIKITLDGNELIPKDANGNYVEPFIIEGTTYLPVRGIANALGLGVDWDGNTKTVLLSTPTMLPATGYENSQVCEGIRVVDIYKWSTSYDNYVAFILENISDKTVDPRIQVSFKTADGSVIGAANGSDDAFGPGNKMAIVLSNDDKFDTFEYIITSSETRYYEECVSKLEAKVSKTDSKAIIQVKNNGDEPARFVEYMAFFKQGGSVVSYDWGYCVDDSSEIKPGMTEMREASAGYMQSFDEVEVYFTGYCDK